MDILTIMGGTLYCSLSLQFNMFLLLSQNMITYEKKHPKTPAFLLIRKCFGKFLESHEIKDKILFFLTPVGFQFWQKRPELPNEMT